MIIFMLHSFISSLKCFSWKSSNDYLLLIPKLTLFILGSNIDFQHKSKMGGKLNYGPCIPCQSEAVIIADRVRVCSEI